MSPALIRSDPGLTPPLQHLGGREGERDGERAREEKRKRKRDREALSFARIYWLAMGEVHYRSQALSLLSGELLLCASKKTTALCSLHHYHVLRNRLF